MKIITAQEAAAMVKDGDNIGVVTFGASGTPEEILMEVEKRFLETGHPCDLGYTHAAGGGSFPANGYGVDGVHYCRAEDHLAGHPGCITRWVASHTACSEVTAAMIGANKIAAWNLPLGTILQIYKAQARGERGCLSNAGLGTFEDARIDSGALNQLAKDIDAEKRKKGELCFVNYIPDFYGEEKLYYTGLDLNIGWMRGTTADEAGNISTEKEPYNLELLTMAQAVRANGGKVFVEVEKIVKVGEINPHMVKVPGMYVDYVVVSEHPENRISSTGGYYNPYTTGEARMEIKEDDAKDKAVPFNYKKVLLRRAAMEIKPNIYANFGLGMPQSVGGILAEEGVADYLTMVSESGCIGGVPRSGVDFGTHINVESMTDQGDHFNFFEGQGLDLAMFGLGEADANGDMNTNILNGSIKGVGGFINIATGAKKIVVLGTFTAVGMKIDVKDGKLNIKQDGKYKKFVKQLVQSSFYCKGFVKKNVPVIFITERAVFQATENGLMLTEIAPGVDLEKDVLGQMEFKPLIAEGGPKLMPEEIFHENWGGLKEYIDKKYDL
ncbi:MAG: CoA-transferase [Anaerovoracaceae bacterium]|jgi:propionate CoA-transferase|nr:acylcoa--acetate/3-ketoacidcoatransferase [Bacillota bacterium]MDY2670038.1 CoA-transferase [Anaerovoracaceae bacterium]